MWVILYLLYAFLSFKINFNFNYSNVYELLVGTLITMFVLTIIDILIYKFAFKFTGFMSVFMDSDRSEMRLIHWFVRSLLLLIVFVISLTPLPSLMLSPLIHNVYIYVAEWSSSEWESITDKLTDIYTK